MKYQFEIRLSRMAEIAFSKHVWKYSRMSRTLRTVLRVMMSECNSKPPIVKYVFETLFNSYLIPKPLKNDLMLVVASMGSQILEFLRELEGWECERHLRRPLDYPPFKEYMDEICWTYDGTIDVPETLRALHRWKNLPLSKSTWGMFLRNCLEDCLTDFYQEKRFSQWNQQPTALHEYWIYKIDADLRDRADPVVRNFWTRQSLKPFICMLGFTTIQEHTLVKHFWTLMTDDERKSLLVHLCSDESYNTPFFSIDRQVELAMFLMQQLTFYGLEAERIKVLGSPFMLAHLLEHTYDEIFLDAHREAVTHHQNMNYAPIYERMETLTINRCYFLRQDISFCRVFRGIAEVDMVNFQHVINFPLLLKKLWTWKNAELLGYIVNHEVLRESRAQFLSILEFLCSLDTVIDHEFLMDFIAAALVSEEERRRFKR